MRGNVLGVLFLLVCSSSKVHSAGDCSLAALENCMKSLQVIAQSDNMAFAVTPEELHAVCRQLRLGVGCVEDHMLRCFNKFQRKVFNSVVSGSRQAISDLCSPGGIQSQYLSYASCYKNISTSYKRCASYYRYVVKLSHDSNDSDVENSLRKYCCAFTDFLRCKYHYVALECGPNATEFLQEHTERMSGPLIHQHCRIYTYDSCTSRGRAAWRRNNYLLCICVLLVFLNKLSSDT